MQIMVRKKLNSKEYLDILSLKHYNNLYFNSKYDAYIDNQPNDYDAFLLMYDNDTLISYLAIFAPFDDGVEITGYTHPEHFNKGYFKTLLNKALGLTNSTAYFSICEQSDAAKHLIFAYDASYSHSEYIMYIKKRMHIQKKIKSISIGRQEVVKDEEYLFFIKDSDVTVGEARIVIDGNLINICDVLIYEKYRNCGYGRQLMSHIVHFLQIQYDKSRLIILQVSSKNALACNLYRKLGFEVYEQTDYYKR